MTSSIYIGDKLIVPGGCPICSGKLSKTLQCERPTCGKQWANMRAVQDGYELAESISISHQGKTIEGGGAK